MKIAILAPHAGYMVGGLETAARGLRNQLLEKHQCVIFSLAQTSWTTGIPGKKSSPSYTLVRRLRLNYLNHLLPSMYIIKDHARAEFSYCCHLLPVLRRFDPDIIINFNLSIIALFCRYYRRRYGVPFIHVGEAGCVYIEAKSAMAGPDAYVALTPAARRYIQSRVPGLRVVVIPNGVDLNLFSVQGPRMSLDDLFSRSSHTNIKPQPPLILSTSRLVKEKRLDLLIKAAGRLEKGTLILVGYGNARRKLFELGQKILPDRLIFLDTVNQKELAKLYRSCDVFSLPSTNEAFGNVLVEAMACGLPVVATDEEGFRWMVGEKGGILVDVTDTTAYASALKEACRREFGDGPSRQAQNFSWQVVGEKYEELMESILHPEKGSM
ncbi:MAG: glycosyltransferase family 4 protein [Candidatus Aminicenantes bacterium]